MKPEELQQLVSAFEKKYSTNLETSPVSVHHVCVVTVKQALEFGYEYATGAATELQKVFDTETERIAALKDQTVKLAEGQAEVIVNNYLDTLPKVTDEGKAFFRDIVTDLVTTGVLRGIALDAIATSQNKTSQLIQQITGIKKE